MPSVSVQPSKLREVVIFLDAAEAVHLATVLWRVGGPREGPRGTLQQILDHLRSEGIEPKKSLLNDSAAYCGAIYFK